MGGVACVECFLDGKCAGAVARLSVCVCVLLSGCVCVLVADVSNCLVRCVGRYLNLRARAVGRARVRGPAHMYALGALRVQFCLCGARVCAPIVDCRHGSGSRVHGGP